MAETVSWDGLRELAEFRAEKGCAISFYLDLDPKTVKTRLHRARKLLRKHIEKQIGPMFLDAFPFAGARCERMTAAVLQRLGLFT